MDEITENDLDDVFTHVVYDPYDKCPKFFGDEDECVRWVSWNDPQHASGQYVREATSMERMLFCDGGLFGDRVLYGLAQIAADRMSIPVVEVGEQLRHYGGPGVWARDALYADFMGPMVDRIENFVRDARSAREC